MSNLRLSSIKISLIICFSVIMSKSICVYDAQYYRNNGSKYCDINQILLSDDSSLEAIKFNIGFVHNFDQIVALMKKESLLQIDEWQLLIDKGSTYEILIFMVHYEEEIENAKNRAKELEGNVIRAQKKLQDFYIKNSSIQEYFESTKYLFTQLDDNRCISNFTRAFVDLPILVKLTFADRCLSAYKIDLAAHLYLMELFHIMAEKAKERVEKLNRALFDEAMHLLPQAESSEYYKKVLNAYGESKRKLLISRDEIVNKLEINKKLLSNQQESQEDQLKLKNELRTMVASLRDARNKEKILDDIIIEIGIRKHAFDAKSNPQPKTFTDYFRLLGYI